MLCGYAFRKMPRVRKMEIAAPMRESYKAWKLARAKRKFQVYLKKQQGGDPDRWVN
jgi:hypothetical protein